ncbi:MAG: tryptophan--tRNA ligase [Armatimonadota bacterium]
MKVNTTVVCGMRPSGPPHLGNYLSIMRDAVALQRMYHCFVFVADYHALTTTINPAQLRANAREVVLDFLAAGFEPNQCVLFAQSDVPEVVEIQLLLSMVANKGELERCTTFKEKARTQPDNVNLGLLGYPVLMAADILAHRADKVLIGEDQVQHLEMAREFASRFNHRYGTQLPLPQPLRAKPIRVPGLDGSEKMGKTAGNSINLSDDPETIRRKVMRAVTDSDPIGHSFTLASRPNILSLHIYVSTPEEVKRLEQEMRDGRAGYKEAKEVLADNIIRMLKPLHERRKELEGRDDYIEQVLAEGAEKARDSARQTLAILREAVGLAPFRRSRVTTAVAA